MITQNTIDVKISYILQIAHNCGSYIFPSSKVKYTFSPFQGDNHKCSA